VAKDASAHLLSFQLGNCYLLICMLGVFILNTTTELKVVRAYIWALLFADVGHIGLTAYVMGWRATLAVGDWNSVVFGNIGITLMLFVARCLYLAGFFDGPDADTGPKVVAAPKTKAARSKASKKTSAG
jgi:hypothetical protein